MKWVVSNLTAAGGFVPGRRIHEGFARHWPNASEEEQPLAKPQRQAEIRRLDDAVRTARMEQLDPAPA